MSGFLSRCLHYRPSLSPTLVALLFALYFLTVMNTALWRATWPLFADGVSGSLWFLACVVAFLGCYLFLWMNLLLWPRIGKPLVIFLLLLSAIPDYFMNAYGVVMDVGMIENVFETNLSESLPFFTPALVWHFSLYGVLPSLLLARLRITFRPLRREFLRKSIVMGITLMLAAGVLETHPEEFTYFSYNHRELRPRFNPYNYILSLERYLKQRFAVKDLPLLPMGEDARPGPATPTPQLVVLVIGETARAESQGLQGYARNTTPRMQAAGVHYFKQATSCGTATAISIPCMFSRFGRADFDRTRIERSENALDILQRAGVNVLWLDNDNGCKDVCNRVPHEDLSDARIEGLCVPYNCFDAVLLHDLPARLAALKKPVLLILHLKGSHGPAYYQRYPDAFRRFTPTCDTGELQTCDRQAVINSYDNTIFYTDHILGEVVDLLKRQPANLRTALIYLSDHGESLGENGVYMHAADYASAPSQQTHIPFLMWFSPAWQTLHPPLADCLAAKTQAPVSHDNLFDTLLGLFDVQTRIYRPQLDLTHSCAPASAHF